ncbi:uncharacterized protein LOC116112046 isoform X3 [Pistacia vera]|uniref:uncharacterized protein LOC116112046 isoform X3 n=1 Tax=Pistacia vera TaxID=55513 RepID=UPI0012637154|nr:uncharacterized protein LOC116112046 isoform X3 [Pistacia vera]
MLFYGSLGRCPICNSKLEFEGKRYTCKGMYSEWSTCTFRTKDPQRREEPVKIPDKGSEDNHNQNNTNNVENNNATMDSCGEDCVEAVMVEKAGEYLSCMLWEKLSWKLKRGLYS